MSWIRTCTLVLVTTPATWAADWPGFRGPAGNGVSPEKTLPLQWSPKDNILWKVKLPGPGASSPVVWGERVFLTCFTGVKASELVRHVIAFERHTGKELWHKEFPAPLPENDYKGQVAQHGFATSTPVTDGKRLFVYLGRGGLYAFDLDGKQLWHADLGEGYNVFGSGSSPILWRDRVIVNATAECQSLVALDQATGKVVWKTVVNGLCWSMPVVVDLPDGKQEIVLNGTAGLYGYEPDKGKELWSVDNVAGYNSSTPVTKGDVVYVMNQAFGEKEFMAVKCGGRGDVTKSHVLWVQNKAGASYCSPLLVGNRLFFFSTGGVVMNAADGAIVTQKRLEGVDRLYGSPIVAGDKILLFTRNQGAYVLSADDQLTVLAHNDLGDSSAINASPALADGQIFIRSNEYLYCIGRR